MPDEPAPVELDEDLEVFKHRKQECLDAGLEEGDAALFAGNDFDIGRFRSLVAHDCPITLIRRIVL